MSITALVFLLFFAIGCVLAIARHPIFGLLTYVGAFYASPAERWWGQGLLHDVRWSLVAGAVTLVAILVAGNRINRPAVSFGSRGPVIGLIVFLAWVAVQSFWAIDQEAHFNLIETYAKFLVAMYLIYRCVDRESHLRMFLWAHVVGCAYLGWVVYGYQGGGRFEDFGGSGIGEANAGALQLVTGAVTAGGLLLIGSPRARLALLAVIPLVVNAVVATISRSGFLAMAVAGVVFNASSPPAFKRWVRLLSILAACLLLLLTNQSYWSRIETIKYRGQEVEGIDTGGGRLVFLQAQWRMFESRPWGCGHMCTTVLSPSYLDARYLSGGARASHNTFMTAVVDHGVPGAVSYIALLAWVLVNARKLRHRIRGHDGLLAVCYPVVFASLAAIFVGDMFVQYPRFEARWWFVALVLTMYNLLATEASKSRHEIDGPKARSSNSSSDVAVGGVAAQL